MKCCNICFNFVSLQCSTCGHKIKLETSEKVRGPRGYILATEWAKLTGGGGAILQEMLSALGVPSMTKKTFMAVERDIVGGGLC